MSMEGQKECLISSSKYTDRPGNQGKLYTVGTNIITVFLVYSRSCLPMELFDAITDYLWSAHSAFELIFSVTLDDDSYHLDDIISAPLQLLVFKIVYYLLDSLLRDTIMPVAVARAVSVSANQS